jgi:outer membrane protein
MKNISLIVNIVLAVALGVLFVLHFSLRSQVNEAVSHKVMASGNSNIVYVNMDSLYAKYNEYVDLKDQLQKKQSKMEGDINNRKTAYERKVVDYQDKAQKGLLLTSERQRIEQQLMAEQQELMQYGQKLQNELAEDSRVLNNKLGNNIIEFLKEYNKDGRFQYVFSHVYGGNLLYVNDSLDITNDVIEGLNKKYDKEKK